MTLQANPLKLDAAESMYFARELEAIRAVAFEKKYVQLKALSLIPINTNFDPADEIYTYRAYDSVGVAKLIASYAKDFPRADSSGQEYSSYFKSFGASYGWNLQELRAAKKVGRPLDQRRAMAAKKAIDFKLDSIATSGDAAAGLKGLLNLDSVLNYTIPSDGTGSSKLFENKTSVQVLRDLHNMAGAYMAEQTSDVEHPDTMLLPLSTFNMLMVTPMSNIDQTTILQAFLKNSIYVKNVVPWLPLETAGSGGTRRAVTYRRDPDVLEFLLPVPFEQFPPEQEKLEYTVACHARCGGVVNYFPSAVQYSDGF